MALKLKKQNTNVDAKWFDFDEDTKVLLASIDTPAYQIALERLRRSIQRNDSKFDQGEVGVIDGEKTEYQGQCSLLANFILKDWSGAEDEEGNPLKFSVENAEAMLLGSTELFIFVIQSAGAYAAELREELTETVGKPSPDSSGKKSGAARAPKSAPKSTAA
jgi:hypothetical protein